MISQLKLIIWGHRLEYVNYFVSDIIINHAEIFVFQDLELAPICSPN